LALAVKALSLYDTPSESQHITYRSRSQPDMTEYSYSYSYKLMDLLSSELLMSVSVHPGIKSIFETGSGGCRYYVIW